MTLMYSLAFSRDSNLAFWSSFSRIMIMRDAYLIHNTHRTFRIGFYLFALSKDNLNAISCMYR